MHRQSHRPIPIINVKNAELRPGTGFLLEISHDGLEKHLPLNLIIRFGPERQVLSFDETPNEDLLPGFLNFLAVADQIDAEEGTDTADETSAYKRALAEGATQLATHGGLEIEFFHEGSPEHKEREWYPDDDEDDYPYACRIRFNSPRYNFQTQIWTTYRQVRRVLLHNQDPEKHLGFADTFFVVPPAWPDW